MRKETRVKSHIDWNEMFPRLKKELRDTLLLEAVTLISVSRHRANGEHKPARVIKRRGQKRPMKDRHWRESGDGGKLCREDRVYKVMADASPNPNIGGHNSKLAKVWAVLTKHGTGTVTYEALSDLVEQVGLQPPATSAQLWGARRIEVVK